MTMYGKLNEQPATPIIIDEDIKAMAEKEYPVTKDAREHNSEVHKSMITAQSAFIKGAKQIRDLLSQIDISLKPVVKAPVSRISN